MRRRARWAWVLGSVTCIAVAFSCSDQEQASEDPGGSVGTYGRGPDFADDAGLSDVQTQATTDGAVSPPCPARAGPVPVRIEGAYCIDSTEVTVEQYQQFVNQVAPDAAGWPAGCGAKTNFTPRPWPPDAGTPQHPVTGVDWCDAYVFCKWAGKELCGALGGGAVSVAQSSLADRSQWTRACTAGGTRNFPYGSVFEAGACNQMGDASSKTAEVKSFTRCQGGFEGIFDMVGNVSEWENACATPDGASPSLNDLCQTRGGGADFPDAQCSSGTAAARGTPWRLRGFRCCSP